MAVKNVKATKEASILILNDGFTPTRMEFTEGNHKIEIFAATRPEYESCRIQIYDGEKFITGMRLPLYALTALAQMALGALNGQPLLKDGRYYLKADVNAD